MFPKDIEAARKPAVVARRGTPVVKVVPVETEKSDLSGFMAGEFKITGDMESPVVAVKQWKFTKKKSCSTRAF
jgi:antitoxin (DNA-binding transcriptional repressor) of toxin-antitoxin stability system